MEKEPKTKKLVCIITGKSFLASTDYFQKKVAKAGSEENLRKMYVCREAKDLLLRGHTVDEIRKLLGTTINEPIPEEIVNSIINQKMKNRLISRPQIPIHYETEKDVLKFLESLKK